MFVNNIRFGVVIIIGTASAALAQHEGDIVVGRSQDGRLRAVAFAAEEFYVPLKPVSGLLNGWTSNEPGFDRVEEDDPGNDLFALQPGAQVWLQVVDVEPAFRVIDSSFGILDNPGEQTFLGGNNLHAHVTWHINSSDPEFDLSICIWEATFVLLDLGSTGYDPSEPFTFGFTNVARAEAAGDWDADGDVDQEDFATWQDCFSGPASRPAPETETNCEIDCLSTFDFDEDDDTDLADFMEFANRFGSP